ncbi:pyruvate kinase [Granulicella aggregans]|uniref:pyruvate kinase n=1 Tax=Granulicella aggregans TaxID=474949 RepID=UPI0021DF800B|nr:pyruvate kinase [Granulicella aggregans]
MKQKSAPSKSATKLKKNSESKSSKKSLAPLEAAAVPAHPLARGRRAKIVATLGPASSSEEVFRQLVRAGLDVARLNFSHGSHEQKAALIKMVRKVSREEGKPICILADLQGPKIRTGKLVDHKPVLLVAGERLTITPREIEGTKELVGTTFTTLAENLEPGSQILLSDGLIELRVETIGEIVDGRGDVTCEIINGGMLGENKGINLPGIAVNVPSLTEKDEEDLIFAIGEGVDTIAVSFVRTADDVRHVKKRLDALKSDAWIIAKLEKPQAIEHLDSILEVADCIMVARGDLGVEVPPEKVPAIQKHIIRRAAEYRRPVITATQMLESMIDNPRPTRAEVSDVANAIYDGSDAVMLSAESAAGKYPVASVAMMAKIVVETEHQMRTEPQHQLPRIKPTGLSVAETICECMAHAAEDLDVGAIAIFTETGATARLLSKYRPDPPIFALSPNEEVINRSMLLWGTYPILCSRFRDTDKLIQMAESSLLGPGYVHERQIVGIVAGTRTRSGATNFMRLHMIGDREPDILEKKPKKKKK